MEEEENKKKIKLFQYLCNLKDMSLFFCPLRLNFCSFQRAAASSRVSTSDSDTAVKDGGRRAKHRQAVLFIRQCGYMCFH